MKLSLYAVFCLIAAGFCNANSSDIAVQTASPERKLAPKVREFTFHYRFRVKGLKAPKPEEEDAVRVWVPCPSNSKEQEIVRRSATAPAKVSEAEESRFGNRILFFQTRVPDSGEFTVDIPYDIVRREVLQETTPGDGRAKEKLDGANRRLFLGADMLVPIDGKPLKLLAPLELRTDRLQLARQLYDLVDDHVAYKKVGTGWGRGDTNWVCDSRYGNCTDFHSLFMSLARSQGLPARFEIGFSIPSDKRKGPITGYHCWAWFHLDDRGWIPVDISEADKHPELKDYYFGNLTADRAAFSTGRDLELVPKANHGPLNYFVFPHIEVGGETLPSENVELQFAFEEKP
jgi:transglutaminase-like putative cysteine protease